MLKQLEASGRNGKKKSTWLESGGGGDYLKCVWVLCLLQIQASTVCSHYYLKASLWHYDVPILCAVSNQPPDLLGPESIMWSCLVRILGFSGGLWPSQEQTEFIVSLSWGGGNLDFRCWFSTSKHPWVDFSRQSLDRTREPQFFVSFAVVSFGEWMFWVLWVSMYFPKDSELSEFNKAHKWPWALLQGEELQTRFLQCCMDLPLPFYLHPATSQKLCEMGAWCQCRVACDSLIIWGQLRL